VLCIIISQITCDESSVSRFDLGRCTSVVTWHFR